jgi:Predicted transcriptional regulator
MTEFSISRRTALRDVKELEEMGVPIYVETGRNGKYHILKHTLFVPIIFSENEIASILFAIQALEKLLQTPFDKSYTQIYQKLLYTLPQNKKTSIDDYLSNIEYKSVPTVANSDHLREVLSAAQNNQIIEMEYTQYGSEIILVYIYDLFSRMVFGFSMDMSVKLNPGASIAVTVFNHVVDCPQQ